MEDVVFTGNLTLPAFYIAIGTTWHEGTDVLGTAVTVEDAQAICESDPESNRYGGHDEQVILLSNMTLAGRPAKVSSRDRSMGSWTEWR